MIRDEELRVETLNVSRNVGIISDLVSNLFLKGLDPNRKMLWVRVEPNIRCSCQNLFFGFKTT